MSEVSPFWRRVRELIREIAVELYMQDHRHLDVYVKPEISELREGGYLERARAYALRKIMLEEPGTPTLKKLPRRVRVSLNRWLTDKPVGEKKNERTSL